MHTRGAPERARTMSRCSVATSMDRAYHTSECWNGAAGKTCVEAARSGRGSVVGGLLRVGTAGRERDTAGARITEP